MVAVSSFLPSASGDAMEVWLAGPTDRGAAAHPGPGTVRARRLVARWAPGSPLITGRRLALAHLDDRCRWRHTAPSHEGRRRSELPTWSQDGQWIYFSGTTGNGHGTSGASRRGRPARRVTHGAAGVVRMRVGGWQEPVVPTEGCATPRFWRCQLRAVQRGSWWHASSTAHLVLVRRASTTCACDPAPSQPFICSIPKTGRDRLLGTLEDLENALGCSACRPTATTVLYPSKCDPSADLMLIENFR